MSRVGVISRVFFLVTVMLFFTSCGYKPSAKYARVIVGEKISTSVIISAQDPENTVVIKDAVDAAVIEVFHASLTTRSLSTTHLEISLNQPSYSPTQYDTYGYIIAYRTAISLKIKRYKDGKMKLYTTRGTYDFTIVANAVITDQERFNAIKFSSAKAIKAFITQVSAEGARVKKEE